jgi:hypothetical protein
VASAGLPLLSAAAAAPVQRKTAIEWNKQVTFVQPADGGEKVLCSAIDSGLRSGNGASVQDASRGDTDNGLLASWQDRPDAAVFKDIFDEGDAAAAIGAEDFAQQDGESRGSSSNIGNDTGDGPTAAGRVMFKPRTNRKPTVALARSTSSNSGSIITSSLRTGLAAMGDESHREESRHEVAVDEDDEEELPNWAVAALAKSKKSSKKDKLKRR